MKASVILIAISLSCNSEKAPSSEKRVRNTAGIGASDKPASGIVPRSQKNEALPFEPGQWVRYRLLQPDRQTTTLTYKVTGVETDAVWIEIVTGAAIPGNVISLLVKAKDRSTPEAFEIRAAKIKGPNDHVRELRGAMLKPTEAGYRNSLSPLALPALDGLPQAEATAPAGKFEGAFQHPASLSLLGSPVDSSIWRHPAVPITALVKTAPVSSGPRLELEDYGKKGATSSL